MRTADAMQSSRRLSGAVPLARCDVRPFPRRGGRPRAGRRARALRAAHVSAFASRSLRDGHAQCRGRRSRDAMSLHLPLRPAKDPGPGPGRLGARSESLARTETAHHDVPVPRLAATCASRSRRDSDDTCSRGPLSRATPLRVLAVHWQVAAVVEDRTVTDGTRAAGGPTRRRVAAEATQ